MFIGSLNDEAVGISICRGQFGNSGTSISLQSNLSDNSAIYRHKDSMVSPVSVGEGKFVASYSFQASYRSGC
jgi:hypothetical protein